MSELLPERRRVLRDYIMAASIEEAIAYLAAHPGEAQIIGGGTRLMPLLQRGQAVATRLVDVSRITALKRVRVEGEHLIIGGAVTFGQVLNKELIASHMPVLLELAQMVSASSIRREASLAGSIVYVHGNSEAAITLIALSAEAEIANLTGLQWVPMRALYVRPGVSRVNSAAEIVTAVRIPLLGIGQGAALARIEPFQSEGHSPLVVAAALHLGEGEALAGLNLAIGVLSQVPRLWRLNDLASGRPATIPGLRQIVSETTAAYIRSIALGESAPDPGQAGDTAVTAYERALERARAGRLR